MCGYLDIFFLQSELPYAIYKKGDYIFARSKAKAGPHPFLLRLRELVPVIIAHKRAFINQLGLGAMI